MALRLKKNKLRLSTVTTGAVVLGAGYLIFKTYPHLKESILSLFTEKSSEEREEEEESGNDVIQLNNDDTTSLVDTTESLILKDKISPDASKWTDATLKSYLAEKEVCPPPNVSHDELVSIAKSVQQAL